MRKGVLSDQTIRKEYAAFFVADEITHRHTLSQHHEHVRGNSRPQRARRPRIPFYTLYDTARYVDRANPYETAHEMVANYTATVTPSSPSSTPVKAPPTHSQSTHSPASLAQFAAAFNTQHPDLVNAPLDTTTRAFLQLSQLDPDRVLQSRTMGRFGTGERIFSHNSLEDVEQRALDFTQRRPDEHAQVLYALNTISAGDDVQIL